MNNFDSTPINSFAELQTAIEKSGVTHDIEAIERAFKFAESVHGTQLRKSGEPFIIHPLTVAAYVARIGLDTTSIIAALLHDTVEDTQVTIDEIDQKFGTEVAYIVDGMTTVKKYANQFPDYQGSVEQVQHLLIKSAGDIRVLIVRLADKLHNGLTARYLSEESSLRFAKGVRAVFAPLAEYLGLGFFKKALDDIAFQILQPKEYEYIVDQFARTQNQREAELDRMLVEINNLFGNYHLQPLKIYGRTKGIYSTYKKLQRYQASGRIAALEVKELFDTVAITVIVNNVSDCYLALGLVHSKWEYVPEEFNDYISNPKTNGYRSLQTAININGQHIEIQFKTKEMHDFNEFGPASHIAYKLFGAKKVNKNFDWMKGLSSWQDKEELAAEDFKVKTFAESVFVFTPKGAVKRLDSGATPIDFAFQVHSGVGITCAGAKVNGKLVPLQTKLKTGDVVEIQTDKKQKFAKPDWLKVAYMPSTRHKIRRSLKDGLDLVDTR